MSPPWMPLWIADFLGDTSHLDDAETGAYILLIMHYWMAGSLPDDDKKLARIARSTPRRWATMRPTIQAFFHDGWHHGRIDRELKRAAEVSASYAARARQAAETRWSKHASSNASGTTQAVPQPCLGMPSSQPHPERKKDPGAGAPDAGASRDIRADLFGRGLTTLATITGKTPDSCRSLVGKWLKSVNDEAIHVLAAIDDAERNRIVDPVPWINRKLKPHEGNGHGKRTVHDAASDLLDRVRALDEPGPDDLRDGTGQGAVRRLPAR